MNCGMFNAVGQQVCSNCRSLLSGFCLSCGAGIDPRARFCQVCGTPVNQFNTGQSYSNVGGISSTGQTAIQKLPVDRDHNKQLRKSIALRIIAGIYRVFGWFIMVAGGIFSILFSIIWGSQNLTSSHSMGGFGIIGIILLILVGIFIFCMIGITYLAVAEGIYIFIDIEANTRASADKNAKAIS